MRAFFEALCQSRYALKAESTQKLRLSALGFTLLEVMIAMAVLGIALLALLALHRQSLQSVVRMEQMSRAAMLAQQVMTQAELERFPPVGSTSGVIQREGAEEMQRWERKVEPSPLFPDLRKVTVRVLYGPDLRRTFELVELIHNPFPLLLPGAAPFGAPMGQPSLMPNSPAGVQ
jgi:general secretion pathway protein I